MDLFSYSVHQNEDREDKEEFHLVFDPAKQPEQGHGEDGTEDQHTDDLNAQATKCLEPE